MKLKEAPGFSRGEDVTEKVRHYKEERIHEGPEGEHREVVYGVETAPVEVPKKAPNYNLKDVQRMKVENELVIKELGKMKAELKALSSKPRCSICKSLLHNEMKHIENIEHAITVATEFATRDLMTQLDLPESKSNIQSMVVAEEEKEALFLREEGPLGLGFITLVRSSKVGFKDLINVGSLLL